MAAAGNTDTAKLRQIVQILAEVRILLDGGWHYSSPIIRTKSEMLLETPDALGIVNEIVVDLELLSTSLFEVHSRTSDLGVNTMELCGADLELLARAYQQLSQDIAMAVTRANDLLMPAAKPERKRAARTPKTSPSSPSSPSSTSNQVSLLDGLATEADHEVVQ